MANSRKAAPDPRGAIAACLARHLPAGGRITLGYSGGLDSTVLLHVLAALAREDASFQVSALHVHHGLSSRADAWAAHCLANCERLGIALDVARVRVAPAGEGPEAAARAARYRIFEQLDSDAVLLAQHCDDQAETVLLQLMRGASARSLAAMPEARVLNSGALLLRPLLELRRADLLAYAEAHGLDWVEDESNQDTSLARNQLRHAVLPDLEAAQPGFSLALARAAGQFAEWAGLLDSLADADGADAVDEAGLALAHLRALPEARARNLLRRVLERRGARVRRAALVEATRQLREGGGHARMDFGEFSLVRHAERVQVVPRAVFGALPASCLAWRGEHELDLGGAGRVLFRRVASGGVALSGENVWVRQRRAGDRVCWRSPETRRALKDVLREAGIPSWRRPWLPVLEMDGRIVWVADLGAMASARAAPEAPGWAISWCPPW